MVMCAGTLAHHSGHPIGFCHFEAQTSLSHHPGKATRSKKTNHTSFYHFANTWKRAKDSNNCTQQHERTSQLYEVVLKCYFPPNPAVVNALFVCHRVSIKTIDWILFFVSGFFFQAHKITAYRQAY